MTLKYIPTKPVDYAKAAFVYPSTWPDIKGKRIILEVGPGRGDFLFHLADQNPSAIVVGVEIKGQRTDKLIKRTEKRGLKNICLIQDDVRSALPRHFAEDSVDEIHVQFPDPWPKNKHTKNRAIGNQFLGKCARILKRGGKVTIVTDSKPYAEAIIKEAKGIHELKSENNELTGPPELFPTLFAQKWKNEGRQIYYQRYVKQNREVVRTFLRPWVVFFV